MTAFDTASLVAIWTVGAPLAVYGCIHLMRFIDRHMPMPEGM